MARTIQPTTTDTTLLDTNVYNTIDGTGLDPVQPSFGTTSVKAAGIVKLVNRFLKLLYTLKGSNYLDKEEGTNFIQLFNLNVQDTSVAQARVQDAIDDATEQIIAVQSAQGVPNSERLRAATMTRFQVDESRTVNIEITLEVLTGGSTTVQLPSITVDTL